MKPFLDPIMENIKTGLQSRGRKNAPSEEPIFQCIGMLAAAVGPNLTKLLHDQLDLMIACGLSEPLVQALSNIVKYIPPLLKTVQGTEHGIILLRVFSYQTTQTACWICFPLSSAGSPTNPSAPQHHTTTTIQAL